MMTSTDTSTKPAPVIMGAIEIEHNHAAAVRTVTNQAIWLTITAANLVLRLPARSLIIRRAIYAGAGPVHRIVGSTVYIALAELTSWWNRRSGAVS